MSKSHQIVGACLSQYSDDVNAFEFLVAYSDGREIGYSVSRYAAKRIAEDFNAQLDIFPPALSTPPHEEGSPAPSTGPMGTPLNICDKDGGGE